MHNLNITLTVPQCLIHESSIFDGQRTASHEWRLGYLFEEEGSARVFVSRSVGPSNDRGTRAELHTVTRLP